MEVTMGDHEGDIFQPPTPEEAARRAAVWEAIVNAWRDGFKARSLGLRENADGSYDVDGDVNITESFGESLPVSFNRVNGNFSCCGSFIALEGIGFPNEVTGNLFLHNQAPGENFREEDIRRVCNVHGDITVEFHAGI